MYVLIDKYYLSSHLTHRNVQQLGKKMTTKNGKVPRNQRELLKHRITHVKDK